MFKQDSKKKKIAAFTVAGALVLGGGGAAIAYWTSQGTGVGTATTGTSTPWTVTSDVPNGAPLIPGGEAQEVPFTFTNESTERLVVTGVTVTVANPDGTAWTSVPGCSANDYTVTSELDDPGIGIPAGGLENGWAYVSMKDTNTNQDACKGANVPLYIVIS